MKFVSTFFLLCIGQWIGAQDFMGRVVDAETGDPLIGAVVNWEGVTNSIETTDLDGRFPISRNLDAFETLKISFLGYQELSIQVDGLFLESLTFRMEVDESNIAVSPIIIGNPFISNDISFNRKEFQILPGAYEDPSRLLLKAPGFTTSNDQANSILYKGFPSNLINWNINNALIVNPNHLSNAGTLSDVSSANAGGVNMVSGQVIGKYDFQSAPYGLPGNNAIAGNSNMEFSDYNKSYLNLSLVGLEAGYGWDSGPYPSGQVNYRYSTVGILTGLLGLDFGGEEIVYQDLFAKLDLLEKEDEQLSAYVVLGANQNHKDSVEVRDSATTFKDVQQINFDSRILLSGLKYEKKWEKYVLTSSLNFSLKSDLRTAVLDSLGLNTRSKLDQSVISGIVDLRKGPLNFGLKIHRLNDEVEDLRLLGPASLEVSKASSNVNLQPYVNYQFETSRFYLNLGSGLSYNSLTSNILLEPSIKGVVNLTNAYSLEVNFRRNSQLIPESQFLYDYESEEMIGNHLEAYFRIKQQKLTAFVSGFYHYMSNILVEKGSYYSQFTGLSRLSIGDYSYEGRAEIKGLSLGFSTRNLILENLNINANASFFSSDYRNDQGEWASNTFSFRESYNFLVSYQRKLKKDKECLISFSAHTRGGLNEFLIDPDQAGSLYAVEFDYSTGPVNRLRGYNRLDFRIVYNLRKGEHRRFAKSISLDIQNITNIENDAFTNYDFLSGEDFVQKQLGLIPILAYRIEF